VIEAADSLPTPDTVTEAIDLLAADGYAANFSVRPGVVRCPSCHEAHQPREVMVDRIYRFEGPSDPGDEAIVVGLRCPTCGARGVLVSGYGPTTDPDDIDVLLALTDAR
jgi:hypothetical protein